MTKQSNTKKLLGQAGFTLTEVLISLGLISVAAVAVMNLADNINSSTKRAEYLLNKSQFGSLLNRYIYSYNGCDELMGLTFRPTPPTTVPWTAANTTPITFQRLHYEDKILTSGAQYKDFTVNYIRGTVNRNTATLPRIRLPNPPSNTTFTTVYKSLLAIEAQVKMNRGDQTYNYYFNLPVLITGTGIIRLCSDYKDMAETCVSAGGLYDTVTKTCTKTSICESTGYFEKLQCQRETEGYIRTSGCDGLYGVAVRNPVTNNTTCPVGSTSHQTHVENWTTTYEQDKKTYDQYNQKTWVSCLKCPP